MNRLKVEYEGKQRYKEVATILLNFFNENKSYIDSIQEIFLFTNFYNSAFIIAFFELSFVLCHIFSFSKLLLIPIVISIPRLYDFVDASMLVIFSKSIKRKNDSNSSNLRSTKELAAYFATIISFIIDFFELLFVKLNPVNFINMIIGSLLIFLIFAVSLFLGDFWILFLMFNLVLVVPGLYSHPLIQKLLLEDKEPETIDTVTND